MRLNPKVLSGDDPVAQPTAEQLRVQHRTVQAVTADLENLSFNTAISRLMEFVNYFTGQESRPWSCMEAFVLMLAPLAPHISEELWQALGHGETLAFASWPSCDEQFTREDTIEIPIQVNGRLRGRLIAPADTPSHELELHALSDPKVQKHTAGKQIRKVIVVPKKLVNIVAG
jgi:leucyl-tRNA synthetase